MQFRISVLSSKGPATYVEPSREIPVTGEYDVVVAGGGTAGTVAAIAAARNGARTLLIESFGFLGGTATAALVTPMMSAHINGLPLVTGISSEINSRLKEAGNSGQEPGGNDGWFNPEALKMVLQDMALESGVALLYHTAVCLPIVDNRAVRGLIVENKSGRQAIMAKVVVDATGDGDVAARAGAPFDSGAPFGGEKQAMSLRFQLGNVDMKRFWAHLSGLRRGTLMTANDVGAGSPFLPESQRGASSSPSGGFVGHAKSLASGNSSDQASPGQAQSSPAPPGQTQSSQATSSQQQSSQATSGVFSLAMVWGSGSLLEPVFQRAVEDGVLLPEDGNYFQLFLVPGRPGELEFNCPRIFDQTNGTDAGDLTHAQVTGRQAIRRLVNFCRQYIGGCDRAYLVSVAPMVGVRESRRIIGQYVLTVDDVLGGSKFPDAVARNNYPLDIHRSKREGPSLRLTSRLAADDYYEVPYRCLLPITIDNLLVAGRCLSSTFEAQSSVRIQYPLRAIGQAAGTAAALAVKEGVAPKAIDGRRLRQILVEQGMNLA